MTSTSIKRGSIVKTLIPLTTYGNKIIPVGTIGTVYRRSRTSTAPLTVGFEGSYTTHHLGIDQVEPAALTNQKVPKPGDIFYSTWGYEQTNCDFYIVEAVKNQTIKLRPVRSIQTYTGHLCGTSVPDTRATPGDSKAYRLRYDIKGNPYVRLSSYSGALPWNGEPVSFSEWH